MSLYREKEAVAIFATHGVLDAGSTALAALLLGSQGEGNPLMHVLLEQGVGWALGTMLLVVGLLSAAWPRLASRYEFPRWFAPTLAGIGALVAIGNLGVILA